MFHIRFPIQQPQLHTPVYVQPADIQVHRRITHMAHIRPAVQQDIIEHVQPVAIGPGPVHILCQRFKMVQPAIIPSAVHAIILPEQAATHTAPIKVTDRQDTIERVVHAGIHQVQLVIHMVLIRTIVLHNTTEVAEHADTSFIPVILSEIGII